MAIEGLGTESSPLLVHNYDELKTACEITGDWSYVNKTRYVRLVEDIDWNEDSRTWEAITLGYASSNDVTFVVALDLYGHTIKNILLENEKNMFLGVYWNDMLYSSIKSTKGSGKLLNIFSNGSYAVIGMWGSNGKFYSPTGEVIPIKNISISVNATSMKSAAFISCYFENCALYYVNSAPSETFTNPSGVITSRDYSPTKFKDYGSDIFKNCDIYLDIKNIDTSKMYRLFSSASSTDITMTDCRISGKLTSTDYNGVISKDGFLLNKSRGYLRNCVVDIEAKVSASHYFFGCYNGHTGVINGEKMKAADGTYMTTDGQRQWDMTYAWENHIKDADWLNDHGFNVVPIG